MTGRRLPWRLVVGGLVVVGGAALLLFVLGDRAQESGRRDGPASPRRNPPVAVHVTDSNGTTRRWCLLAARSESERERGLMHVRDPSLGGHDGMAFLFARDARGGFWMRNTPLPLSIAYLDRKGGVVSTADMAPCGDSPDCPTYAPARPYRAAIEVPLGRLPRLGIGPGSRTEFGGRCTGRTAGG